jgi:DNA-binding NarL/FixJ family response regulator
MAGCAVEVVLKGDEREVLERWARRPKSAQALALLRCRIVLAAAEGQQSKEIAERLGCSRHTVGKWRRRFARRASTACTTSRDRASQGRSPMKTSSG